MIEREELHRLLDKMLDSGDCVGDYQDAVVDEGGTIRITDIRLVIEERNYAFMPKVENNPQE